VASPSDRAEAGLGLDLSENIPGGFDLAKRIGILTGGGDVPGLNPCIRAVVERAIDEDLSVLGIRRGWMGLLALRTEDPASRDTYLEELNKRRVRTVGRLGGTFLHTSRCNPAAVHPRELPQHLADLGTENGDKTIDATAAVLDNLEQLELDALIAIGGDDTLSFAERLDREGAKVIAIPKTMDNDVYGTDYCIGFSTAITRSVEFINQLRTVAGSHERILVVELFGRNSGETALISSWLADVDRTVISEVPFDPARVTELLLRDKGRNPSGYSVLTVSEGARMKGGDIMESGVPDAYGHRKLGGIGRTTAEYIKDHSRENILYQQLSYLMRSGTPDSLDRMVSRNFGNMAVELIKAGEAGQMVCLEGGCYGKVALASLAGGKKNVDVENFYDCEMYRAKVPSVAGLPMFLY
jgi:6-phosphofructokinase